MSDEKAISGWQPWMTTTTFNSMVPRKLSGSEVLLNYTNPGYGLLLVDTLWNAGSYRQPLEQEGNPMT